VTEPAREVAAGVATSTLDVSSVAPCLSVLSKLKEKDLAAQKLMILEGRIAIEKALDAGILPRFLVCTEAEEEYWRSRSAAFPVRAMSHEALCALVDFKFHRGAIAVADMPKLVPFEGAVTAPREVFLCLWDVTDPSNLGALLRTAAGLGVAGALLGPGCANPYYRKAIRASMGNVFNIPLWSADLDTLQSFNRNGARIVAASLTEKALTIAELSLSPWNKQGGLLVLILGNEGYGLPTEVLNLCTDEVRIPMARGVDSLNVAVAGGILMYELLQRRQWLDLGLKACCKRDL